MMNKELLSEVLGINIFEVLNEHDNYLVFGSNSKTKYSIRGEAYCHINIYELAHKCKEWAITKGYFIIQDTRGYTKVSKLGTQLRKFWEDEEYTPERTFDSCQWILDNNERK